MKHEDIAARYLFVDMAIKNMQLDLQHVRNGPYKIKQPYITVIKKIISNGMKERRKLKKSMYDNRISVEFNFAQGDYTTYIFYLSGRKEEKTYHNMVIKKNVEEIMMKLSEGN